MELRYDEIENDVLIIVADGGLNADTADQLVEEIGKLVDAGLRQIIVDCSKLEHVSSTGLGALVSLHNRMRAHGGDVRICAVRGMLAEILQLTRLARLFKIYPDVNRARLELRER